MEQASQKRDLPPFLPTLDGCVSRDLSMAWSLEQDYWNLLYGVSSYTYRALICEKSNPLLCDLFDEMAIDECEQFRLLGRLIFALGKNPNIHVHLQVGNTSRYDGKQSQERGMVLESIKEEKRRVDRYQTLMGQTKDRVVRSILAYLLSGTQAHIERLRKMGE